jgi:hypothetical protein
VAVTYNIGLLGIYRVFVMNVWNSRALDVHRWSEYPQVNIFIDGLWETFASHYPEYIATKRGKQPKTKPKNQFKVLLLDLFVCWQEDEDQCIGISRNVNAYLSVDSRYNKLHISKLIIKLTDQLTELGWVDFINGSYNHEDPSKNRTSRIKPADYLIKRFAEAEFGIDSIGTAEGRECIILKSKTLELDALGNEATINEEIEYEDTQETEVMRSSLRRYNDLLQRTHIDIRDLDKPIIEKEVQTKFGPRTYKVKVTQSNKFVRRIFSNASWESHGRLYGGFWQQVNEDTRSRIFIDHHETIEVDFKSLHIYLLYAYYVKEPLPFGTDPYTLKSFASSDESSDVQRARLKTLLLQAINASSRIAAFGAFRNEHGKDHPDKKLKNTQLSQLLEDFLAEHPKLEPYICSGLANELMYIDGCITFEIIRRLTQLNIPVLTVHDSYIVKLEDYEELRHTMYLAATRVIGHELYAVQELIPIQCDYSHAFELEQYMNSISHYMICKGYEERYSVWKSYNKSTKRNFSV